MWLTHATPYSIKKIQDERACSNKVNPVWGKQPRLYFVIGNCGLSHSLSLSLSLSHTHTHTHTAGRGRGASHTSKMFLLLEKAVFLLYGVINKNKAQSTGNVPMWKQERWESSVFL